MRRRERTTERSIGADVLSLSSARALGLDSTTRLSRTRMRARVDAADQDARAQITARPAVYTDEAEPRRRSRTATRTLMLPTALGRLPLILAIVLASLALVAGILWGPTRAYYLAWRESGVLQVEYSTLSDENASLNHKVDRLQTLEGIEDEARRRGYVYPNEEALVAEGVEEEQVADPNQVQEAIDAYENSLPWYVHLLDSLFGYRRT